MSTSVPRVLSKCSNQLLGSCASNPEVQGVCDPRPMRLEPPPSQWDFPDARAAGSDEIVAVGGDLEPGTLVAAYRQGLFPMRVRRALAWWSPDPRGVMPLDGFRASRSLRRSRPRVEVRVGTAFEAGMR